MKLKPRLGLRLVQGHSELMAVKTRNQALQPPPSPGLPRAFPTPPPQNGCLDSHGLHPGIPLPQNIPCASATTLWALPGNRPGGLRRKTVNTNRNSRELPPACTCYWLSGREDWAWERTQGRELGRSWLDGKFGVCPSQTGPETIFHFKVPTLSLCQHNSKSQ